LWRNRYAEKRQDWTSSQMFQQTNLRRSVLQLNRIDTTGKPSDNSSMKSRRDRSKHKEIKEKRNQFGNPLAKAIETTIYAWKCSECGAIMPMTGDKPPFRCSNRKGCGRVFYNE
jgi:rubrerythrin